MQSKITGCCIAGIYSMLFEINPSEQERVLAFSKRTLLDACLLRAKMAT